MSIVTDVLLTAGSLDKMDVFNKLTDYIKCLEETKLELLESLDRYYSLSGTIEKFKTFETKFRRNVYNIEKLEDEIKIFIKSEQDKDNECSNDLLKEKYKLKSTIALIEDIICMNSLVLNSQTCFKTNDYVNIAQSIEQVKSRIKDLNIQYDLIELKVLNHLIAKNCKIEEKLWSELDQIYHKNYHWEKNSDDKKLTISDCHSISTVLLALDRIDLIDQYAKEFSDNMFKFIIEPVSNGAVCIELNGPTIIIFSNNNKTDINNMKELGKTFIYFFAHMQSEGEILFFKKIGNYLSEKLIDILIEKGYKPVIQDSKDDYTNAVKNFQDLQTLENNWKSIHFVIDVNKRLHYFNRSMPELFVDERCKDILYKCQCLIKSPIHNYIHSSKVEFDSKKTTLVEELDFQPCLISEMMRDLITNCYLLINESKKGNSTFVYKYYKCLINVIQLYIIVAPTYHQKSIQSLPLVAALFYNDCMLMSHQMMLMQMMMLNDEGDDSFQLSLRNLVYDVKKAGIQSFLQFFSVQKSEILRSVDLYDLQCGSDDNFVEIMRGFQQATMQIKHLHKVWTEALPQQFSHKSIGALLNAVMQRISAYIIAMEDISQSDGIKLVQIIDSLLSLSTQLLSPSPVLVLAPKWSRLKEVKFVIEASLQDINDRWADGKGPLAHEFKVAELEALIKALFQNTDRRANLLASLK